MSNLKYSEEFLDKPLFNKTQMYRALSTLADYSSHIQSIVHKNSSNVISRNSKILYYDCTNFFFEDDSPNSIIQMGMFLDSSGIPLSFSINNGNTNKQTTLKPLEEKIIKDFGLDAIVACTDAGINSLSNKKFNSKYERRYITTYS